MMDNEFHNTNYDVITIGSATLDVFFKSDLFEVIEHEGKKVLCQLYDEKIDIQEMAISSGGAGTNTAVGFSRQGFKTACIAEIGQDIASEAILRELERERVDWRLVIREHDEKTGVSGLLISKDGARTALVHRGASRLLTIEDVPWHALEAKHIHLSSVGSPGMIEHVMQFCADSHASLSWSPGNWEIEEVREGRVTLIWPETSMLIMNREEFARFTGKPYDTDELWNQDWEYSGPSIVIITDGARGGVVLDNISNSRFRFEAEKVEVMQETGAGDAFACGFVSEWLRSKDLQAAVQLGKNNAASVVSHMGAKAGLLRATREQAPLRIQELDNNS